MPFIGIITDKKNEIEIENLLKDKFKKENIKAQVIIINEKSIENVKNIKFNAILINGKNNVIQKANLINKVINNANYIVINSDIESILQIMNNIESMVLSYGFNSKSTITASSVSDEEIMVCVQREFQNIKNKRIELQEINIDKMSKNEYITLGIASICLLYGIKC